ncbi:MAG TPA: polysaccharide biosynthesis tyrosine autokinase [Acetobacteraceae bacterium]|nr:polysaccharide biosynthesis tyrosine autokinase [Acetobacteraceae bacterium]
MQLIEPPPADVSEYQPADASADLNIGLLIRTAIRRLPLFVCAVLLGGALGFGALRILPPRYTSWSAIMIDPKRPGSYGMDGAFTDLSVDSSQIANVEQVIASSELLSRVVTSEHLLDNPAFTKAERPLLYRLLPLPGAAPVPETPEAKQEHAVERLGKMIHTEREGITYVISISVTAGDPALSQRLAAAVAEAYLTDQVTTRNEAAERDTSWLTDRLKSQRDDLMKSEAAVEAIRRKYGLLAASNAPETSVDRQAITEVNTNLVAAQSDLDIAAAKYQQAQHVAKDGGNLETLADVASSGMIANLRNQAAEANRRIAELSVRYASGYPALRQAENERAAINRQLAQQASRTVQMLRNDYETAVARRDELQKQLAGLVGAVSAADEGEGRIELREAERVADANRAAYDSSLAGLRQVEQQRSRSDVEARIISYPELPDAPSFPRASICLGAGLGLGALIGAALIFLIPYHRNRVVDHMSARRAASLRVLASAPFLRRSDLRNGMKLLSPHEYLVAKPTSPFAESLKLLRLHLRVGDKNGPKVVQITSATPGEGKSTIAAALAVSAAAAGIRAVVVDLDLHRPSISKIFAGPASEGRFDVLLPPQNRNSERTQPTNLPLSVIDAAAMVAGPRSRLVESTQLQELIADLEKKYDLVVLDTPPVLAISDALFVSHLVDATVMVVAWDATTQQCVENAVADLRAADAPLAGMVLNKVNAVKAARYGMPYYDYEYAAA